MRNKKLYKRLVALILAGCVVVGSSAVGFAADTEETAARLKAQSFLDPWHKNFGCNLYKPGDLQLFL